MYGTERVVCMSCRSNNMPDRTVCWNCGASLSQALVLRSESRPMSAGHPSGIQSTNRHQADLAYNLISGRANTNSVSQALSGMAGFPFTIAADVAVVKLIYLPLWNDLRGIYGHPPVDGGAFGDIIGKIIPEVLLDFALDKILGQIPVIGIYFNAVCAKAMTWRLGTLFAFLSSRGAAVPGDSVQKAMELIRLAFPQKDMFSFSTPDREQFQSLVTSVQGMDERDLTSRLDRALDALKS